MKTSPQVLFAVFLTVFVGSNATFIIGSGVGAGAVAAAGLTGILGLKLIALKGLLLGSALAGAGRRRSYRRRGRRDVSTVAGEDEPMTDEQINAGLATLDVYFELLREVDRNGCGLRLICELETKTDDELADDEALILALFGTPKPLTYQDIRSPKAAYNYAAYMGFSQKDPTVCKRLFDQCTLSGDQLMGLLRSADPE